MNEFNSNQTPTGAYEPRGVPKKRKGVYIVLLLVAIVLAAAIIMRFLSRTTAPPPGVTPPPGTTETPLSEADTTEAINRDITNTNLEDLDSEFRQIDADINQL